MAGLLAIAFSFVVTAEGLVPAAPARTPATTTNLEQQYSITATLDVGAGRMRASERVTLTNRSQRDIDHVNVSVLPRAFGYFSFTGQVRVNGIATDTSWTTRTNLRVELGRWLAPGQTATLRIPFKLAI